MEKARVSVECDREVASSESRWQLVLGMDFSASKRQTNAGCAGGSCLHDLGNEAANPHLQALSLIAMLSVCGSDGHRCHRPMLAYGFGDARTAGHAVFAFSETGQPLSPVDVAGRYRSIARAAQCGNSRSFAPLIWQAIAQQRATGERQAVLILASGDLQWSAHQAAARAAAAAATYGIPIAVLGMGDGPWERIQRLCREQPGVRFAEFGQIASRFPFGRLQSAEEIHRLWAEPAGASEKMQVLPQDPFESPMPMCPPDLVQGEHVAAVPGHVSKFVLALNVLIGVVAVLVALLFDSRTAWLGIAPVAALLFGRLVLCRFGIFVAVCYDGLRRRVQICAPVLRIVCQAA